MTTLRAVLSQALLDAGMYIDDVRFDRVRRAAAALSRQHLGPTLQGVWGHDLGAVAATVGLTEGAIARVFGHGWQQAAGFAALAELRPNRRAAVARLGALLSLGIVLVDQVVDTFAERRAVLTERLTPDVLRAASTDPTGPPHAPAPSGDLGVDAVVALASAVMSGARRLDGRADDHERFSQVIAAMYAGELASVEARRLGEPPSVQAWEALRAKSALPATAVAVLASLGHPAAGAGDREVVDAAGELVGEAFWIVDDLVDVRSDWAAGCWSRPLWLLADRTGETPASGDDAVRQLLDSGIAASEAQRLGHVLAELAGLPGSSQRTLLRPVQAAVRSWVEEIPADPSA